MKVGQIVIFKNPSKEEIWPDGKPVRMQLLEVHDNGKCLVKTLDTAMTFEPTVTLNQSDLILYQGLKTSLPTAINTIEEAKAFLTELNNNGEAYHPEDDAHDIIWNGCTHPTPTECDQLNKLMIDIYNLEGNNGNHANPVFCPCSFLNELDAKG